mmetsp:Transcript_8950/g.15022  ORF Transcript_8950/g.15022 Transcript_8950/m.15022 type:complete len:91 (-) Transcript_8950:398-670(-)
MRYRLSLTRTTGTHQVQDERKQYHYILKRERAPPNVGHLHGSIKTKAPYGSTIDESIEQEEEEVLKRQVSVLAHPALVYTSGLLKSKERE